MNKQVEGVRRAWKRRKARSERRVAAILGELSGWMRENAAALAERRAAALRKERRQRPKQEDRQRRSK